MGWVDPCEKLRLSKMNWIVQAGIRCHSSLEPTDGIHFAQQLQSKPPVSCLHDIYRRQRACKFRDANERYGSQ